jgi:Tol biopolymer transport system component/DNA-binding winged helix-turn-helix (wHTH) protein
MQPGMQSAPVVRFGAFELDVRAGELRKHGIRVKLQDQPFQILVMLLEQPGQVVTREQLHQKLWAEGTFVDFEHGLNAAIQRLRQALGDSADNPRFVETLTRHGYRFLAPVDGLVSHAPATIRPVFEVHQTEARSKRGHREVVAWALVAVVSLAFVALAVLYVRKQPSETHVVRYQIPLPDKVRLESWDIPAISPDGRKLVFAGVTADGARQLWFRSLDSVSTHPLPGTENARMPFWSPDSRFVAFFAAPKMKKIDVTGGPPVTLCDVNGPWGAGGGTWNERGGIVISASLTGYPVSHTGYPVLCSLSSQGGTLKPILEFDKSRHEKFHWLPSFLPDGRHFVYFSGVVEAGTGGICLGSLDSPQTRKLISAESNVSYAPPGFLIYGRQETLLAQPFDIKTLQLNGDVITIAENVARAPDNPVSLFSASNNGVLVYAAPSWPKYQLAWHDRNGTRMGSVGEPGKFYGLALSPDEKRVALFRSTAPLGNFDIWTLELASGIFSRVTTHPDDDAAPEWSPNGRELLFSSLRTGELRLFRKVAGGGDEELLLNSEKDEFARKSSRQIAQQWLEDGSILFISTAGSDTTAFYLWPRAQGRRPELLLKTDFAKDSPIVSKDGKWVAYQSSESGRMEIYVAAFPTFTEKRQVSKDGGVEARWRNDGKELFYLSLDGKVMSVDIKTTTELEAGAPKMLFQTPMQQGNYCVTGDGKRFLIGEPVEESSKPLTVVQNWTAGLKR